MNSSFHTVRHRYSQNGHGFEISLMFVVDQFVGCCGVGLIGRFSSTIYRDGVPLSTGVLFRGLVPDQELEILSQAFCQTLVDISANYEWTYLMSTDRQCKHIKESVSLAWILPKLGFEELDNFVNFNSDNTVVIYGRESGWDGVRLDDDEY